MPSYAEEYNILVFLGRAEEHDALFFVAVDDVICSAV